MPGIVSTAAFRSTIGSWELTRADAGPPVADCVAEYWEVHGELDPFRETLVPSGYLEFMINLGPPHVLRHGGRKRVWEHSWLAGLQEHALQIESARGTRLMSARLHPLGAARLFGLRAPRAANHVVDLSTFLGEATEPLRQQLIALRSAAARFEVLERFLASRVAAGRAVIPDFVARAVALIEREHGRIRVAGVSTDLGMSRKHLTLTFGKYVGTSLKRYASLQRFVWTLNQIRAAERVSWSALATEAGYADQSHLARDFRRFGAATPTEYLRHRAPEGDALLYTDSAPGEARGSRKRAGAGVDDRQSGRDTGRGGPRGGRQRKSPDPQGRPGLRKS